MAAKDGNISFDYEGVYTKVDKFSVIEYQLVDNRTGSVQFESQGDTVKITEILEPEKSHPVTEQKQFCQGVIDNFKGILKQIK